MAEVGPPTAGSTRPDRLPFQYTTEWRNPVTLIPTLSICARIASHAATSPDRLAVVDATCRLTYAELERQSNQLAAYLREAGAGPEGCVGSVPGAFAAIRGGGPGGAEDRGRLFAVGSVHACGSSGVHPR